MSADLVIEASQLTYAYPRGPTALDQLTFQVAAGENVGVIGPNGAGKTSLFLCLCGVLVPQAETLNVGGLDLRDRTQRRLLPFHVGVVFQNSDDQLFNATLIDDVAFGPLNLGLPREEVRRRSAEALAAMELSGLDDRPPFHLSGGEKRRAALAGVLAMRPSILLLDEPSAFLDPRGRREFIRLLEEVPGTKIIASHDLELVVQTCPRVLLLDGGRLMADGPASAILMDEALMEKHGLETPYSLRLNRPSC